MTPLDLIQALDDEDIDRVVLLGSFARAFDIQHFLRETWPSIRVETAG